MEKDNIPIDLDVKHFLERYLNELSNSRKLLTIQQNERVVGSALIYEKIRVALEYQEEHLIFKNAISRIINRKITLLSGINAKRLTSDLVSELAWADYVNPETISDATWETVEKVITKYLVILRSAKSAQLKKLELQKLIINFLACEIDSIIKPKKEEEIFVDFAHSILKKNLVTPTQITEEENEIQLKIAIMGQMFKADMPQIQLWLLKKIYPNLMQLDDEELSKFARSFDPYFNPVTVAINHPNKFRYTQFVRKNIPPFIVLQAALISSTFEKSAVAENFDLIQNSAMSAYNSMISSTKTKIWRGTIRALIFIFLTKMVLAFILEIPFDRMLKGEIDYTSLIVNITLPTLLMLIAGTFVKAPSAKNSELVSKSLLNILSNGKVSAKEYNLVEKSLPRSFAFFNIFYSLISLMIIIGVIKLLLLLNFNIVSIFLFFLFVSAVSFFAFRIRTIALELSMKKAQDDAITSIIELIFMPFIRIGRYLSGQFARFNPFILALDFLIEAPLKTIIHLYNSWRRFISNKKEELEG